MILLIIFSLPLTLVSCPPFLFSDLFFFVFVLVVLFFIVSLVTWMFYARFLLFVAVVV